VHSQTGRSREAIWNGDPAHDPEFVAAASRFGPGSEEARRALAEAVARRPRPESVQERYNRQIAEDQAASSARDQRSVPLVHSEGQPAGLPPGYTFEHGHIYPPGAWRTAAEVQLDAWAPPRGAPQPQPAPQPSPAPPAGVTPKPRTS